MRRANLSVDGSVELVAEMETEVLIVGLILLDVGATLKGNYDLNKLCERVTRIETKIQCSPLFSD
jgi:hypothetical protein